MYNFEITLLTVQMRDVQSINTITLSTVTKTRSVILDLTPSRKVAVANPKQIVNYGILC